MQVGRSPEMTVTRLGVMTAGIAADRIRIGAVSETQPTAQRPARTLVPRRAEGELLRGGSSAVVTSDNRIYPPGGDLAGRVAAFYARHSAAALETEGGGLVRIDVYV